MGAEQEVEGMLVRESRIKKKGQKWKDEKGKTETEQQRGEIVPQGEREDRKTTEEM